MILVLDTLFFVDEYIHGHTHLGNTFYSWLQLDSRYPTSLHVLVSRPLVMKEGVRMWLAIGRRRGHRRR